MDRSCYWDDDLLGIHDRLSEGRDVHVYVGNEIKGGGGEREKERERERERKKRERDSIYHFQWANNILSLHDCRF